jgi:hypothetical protein
LNVGPVLARTVRHFFPDLDEWIEQIEDPRFAPFITYSKRFLLWWGLMLFLTKLGSRRQLDHQLRTDGPEVLANVNRLAGAKQDTCPVNKTLEHFLEKIEDSALAELRRKLVNRLIRMRVLDEARLQARHVVLIDGSGYLTFSREHCEHCLTRRRGETTVYMHQVLEAKVLGPAHTVFSIGTEFIDNRDAQSLSTESSQERIKQDCELKALRRLAAKLRVDFPQLRICLSGDGLFACGEGFQIAKDYRFDYVYTFKAGRMPALWQDFQGLLRLCPEQQVEITTPEKVRRTYRWAFLQYRDSDGRDWSFTGIHLRETKADNTETEWAWVTSLNVSLETVVEIATTGGRERWRMENEGFNIQKNSGLNLEHAYSYTNWAAYYFLLQIAHLVLQLMEKGSLLRQLAAERGLSTAMKLFGSLKNVAQRLLESLRYLNWPDNAFDAELGRRIQIRIDSS